MMSTVALGAIACPAIMTAMMWVMSSAIRRKTRPTDATATTEARKPSA